MLVVIPVDALFRHARRAAGLEDHERLALVLLRHPAFVRFLAQKFAVEVVEAIDIGERGHFLRGIPTRLFRPVEPVGSSGLGREVPAHGLDEVRVQRCVGVGHYEGLRSSKKLSTTDLGGGCVIRLTTIRTSADAANMIATGIMPMMR